MEPTYKRVARVIADLAGLDADKIGPAQSLGQKQAPNFYWHSSVKGAPADPPKPIGLDSLDLVQLAMNLEEEFGISISDEEVDAPALDHVGGLAAFIQGKVDAKPKTYGDIAYQLAAYALRDREPRISDASEDRAGFTTWDGRAVPPAELYGDCS